MPKLAAKKPPSIVILPADQTLLQTDDKEYWEDIPRLQKIDAFVQALWKEGKKEAVCCNFGCSTREFWKLFESKKVWLDFEEVKGKGDDKFVWCRTCWICIMKRENLPDEAAARTWIVQNKSDYKRRQDDNDKYCAAKKYQLRFFTMMSGQEKHKAVKILEKQEEFTRVFTPLAEAILIKDQQMAGAANEWNEAQKLVAELRCLKDSSKIVDAIDRIMLLTAEVPLLAFAGDADQHRKWFATTYADEWTGFMGGWFRSWYICMHGCAYEGSRPVMTACTCGTLVPSKLWNLKIEDDPLADGQRWYCHVNHRYNASWGQVVEFKTVGGRLMYARADVPTGTLQDIRAIAIEQTVGKEATAEEIYESLPVYGPQTSHENIFYKPDAPRTEPQRWYGINPDFYNKLPTFPWYQIFNMTGAPMTYVNATGDKAKKRAVWEVNDKKKELRARIEARKGTSASSLA
jgi:hypothetical protein